jgi:hypothetical protein
MSCKSGVTADLLGKILKNVSREKILQITRFQTHVQVFLPTRSHFGATFFTLSIIKSYSNIAVFT